MFVITNGKIITENSILTKNDLIIRDDKIVDILPEESYDKEGYEIIDAKGGFITPGFIDIHSDYIENVTSPRPNLLMDLNIGLKECEKIICGHGITTMFHSLSFYANDLFEKKPIRNIENVRSLIRIIKETHESKHLIRHRFHGRLEIDNIVIIPEIKKLMDEGNIHLLSFMDHTPGQGQYRDLEVYKKTLKGYGMLEESDFDKKIKEQQSKNKITLEMIKELIDLAIVNNVSIASHDDDTVEKLKLVKELGITISEFPITMEVAEAARELGVFRVAGAPNVLLGGSHTGNLSAAEGIVSKNINILCSDYYPAAMLHALFILHERYNEDLCEMFKLVTINPAKAVKMDGEIGSLEIGKKADILIIRKDDEYTSPTITKTFVDGKLVSQYNYRG